MGEMNPDVERAFLTSAAEQLAVLRKTIAQAGRDPEDPLLWQRLSSALDQLQSDASQAGVGQFAVLVACMKPVPSGVAEGRFHLTVTHLTFLLLVCGYLDGRLTGEIAEGLIPLDDLTLVAEKIYGNEPFTLQGLSPDAVRAPRRPGKTEGPDPAGEDETVSVTLGGLGRIASRLDTVIVHQFQLKKNLDLIQSVGDQIRSLASRLKGSSDGEAAETVVKDLLRLDSGFKEDLAALDRHSFILQEEIAKLRMLPFGVLSGRLEAFVAEASQTLGKKVVLVLGGAECLLDKTILEMVQGPVTELLRNAIVYGVSEQEPGRIDVNCSSDGNTISIVVTDHGPGIDFEAIRRSAIRLFPLEDTEIADMAPAQLSRFLFQPGVTTKTGSGPLVSGNGLGLNEVKKCLDDMQGRISVSGVPGQETSFSLQFPASVSLVSGFFIRSAGERFFISSVFVREVVIFPRTEVVEMPIGDGYRLRNMVIPVLPLSTILEGKETVRKPVEQMVVVELMGETYGLVVDTIVRYASLSYKPLPGALAAMKEIQGVVYDEKFNLVPILHIPAVLGHLKRVRSIEFRDRYMPDRLDFRNILVVDDSPVSRQTLVRILRDNHYQAEGASDGIDALETLHKRFFHLIITDDLMPRMDGGTLTENLRKETEYAFTPIIAMVSEPCVETERHLRAGGIKDFFNKADFDRQALLDRVRSLLDPQP